MARLLGSKSEAQRCNPQRSVEHTGSQSPPIATWKIAPSTGAEWVPRGCGNSVQEQNGGLEQRISQHTQINRLQNI